LAKLWQIKQTFYFSNIVSLTMNLTNKFLTTVFVFMLLSSLFALSVMPTITQAASKPSVPQFSVKFFDSSYDVPPSTTKTVDQYTGKETTTTIPGYHVTQMSVEVTIKNQPFTPYTNEDGQETYLFYGVEVKGHFGEVWFPLRGAHGSYSHVQSNSGYTVVTTVSNYDVGAQLDFRVHALIAYTRELSDYSIQTVTVPALLPSQTATIPSPVTSDDNICSPQSLEYIICSNSLFLLVVGAFLGCVVVVVVIVFLRQHLKTVDFNNGGS
jgi:hypothetical protein